MTVDKQHSSPMAYHRNAIEKLQLAASRSVSLDLLKVVGKKYPKWWFNDDLPW